MGKQRILARLLARFVPPRLMMNKQYFEMWEERGYHITPVHFYEPIPDTRQLGDAIFDRVTEVPGVDLNEQGQIEILERFASLYREEYDAIPDEPTGAPNEYYMNNASFETVDAEILYCMVRDLKPRRIVEIGSGYSTQLSAAAIRRLQELDPEYQCDFVCIEPYPMDMVKDGVGGIVRLIDRKVEDVPMETFTSLGENDILFIDSSHVLSIGNDVWYEYMEILPRIQPGVVVHIHDILMPEVYARRWLAMKVFWNEQYLLQAFLAFNDAFKVLWAGNYMHLKHPDALLKALASYGRYCNNADPGKRLLGHKSFWMRRVR